MRSALCLALVLLSGPCLADTVAAVRHLSEGSDSGRPLALSVWYPSEGLASAVIGGNAVFRGVSSAPDGPLPAEPLPLVVVSHGGLRSADDSGAWLSSSLAQSGFIVVEVSAPRPKLPAEALNEIWQRPRDMRRALDRMLADGDWRARIDPGRIAGVGFALGATAALSVAGAPLHGVRYRQSCARGDGPDCRWLAAGGGLEQTRPEDLARLTRDPRVTAAVAINPEYEAALGEPAVPVLRIILGPGETAPAADGMSRQVALPHATAADAFAVCTPAGPEILAEDGGDAGLCGLSPEARAAIHRQVAELVAAFLADTGK